jgi:hypothetical protein
MRTISLLFSLVLVFGETFSQNYNIIQSDGNIVNVNKGVNLMQGAVVNSADVLKFENNKASALVVNDKFAKYRLVKPQTDVTASVEFSLVPISSRNQLSTRGDEEIEKKDLKSYFGNENFFVIGNKLDIALDKNIYPLSENSFIVFDYQLKDTKISKQIGFDGQKLIIDKEKLFVKEEKRFDGNEIENLKIYKFDKKNNKSELITTLKFSFLDSELLKNEMLTITNLMTQKGESKENIMNYLKQYFIDVYGNTDTSKLNEFVQNLK